MPVAPSTLFLDPQQIAVDTKGILKPHVWRYLSDIQSGLGTIELTSQVMGVLPTANGGTGRTALVFPASGTVVVTTSPVTAVDLNVTAGVNADSGGIKHARKTTGSIGGTSSALVTVTWTTAFADANYTAVATVLDATASTSALSVVHIETQSAAAVAVRVANTSGGNLTGTLNVIAVHDGA